MRFGIGTRVAAAVAGLALGVSLAPGCATKAPPPDDGMALRVEAAASKAEAAANKAESASRGAAEAAQRAEFAAQKAEAIFQKRLTK